MECDAAAGDGHCGPVCLLAVEETRLLTVEETRLLTSTCRVELPLLADLLTASKLLVQKTAMAAGGEALEEVKRAMEPWLMMSTGYPAVLLTALYLVFVTVLAPAFMRNRKPLDLSTTLLAYNGLQVAFSVWWLFKIVSNWTVVEYVSRSTFYPQYFTVDQVLERQIDELCYYYLISKYTELLDTVFFILRQKWSQVTFLHVYHHANMALMTWFYVKFIWGRHIIIIAVVNVFIHVLMYSYYLLSALGPAVRPYLWWKPYITRMQLGQFLVLLLYVGTLMYNECSVQPSFAYFTATNLTLFIILFTDFYRKAYGSHKKQKN